VTPFRLTSSADSALYAPRCRRLVQAAIQTKTRHVASSVRVQALHIWHELVLDAHYDLAHPNALICVSYGHGGRAYEPFLRAITDGLLFNDADHGADSFGAYLVPDGVASVTIHYVIRSGSLQHPTTAPAASVLAPVDNNLAVWRTHRSPRGLLFANEAQWRAADGHVIRTVYF
jgi:hypothetical protein